MPQPEILRSGSGAEHTRAIKENDQQVLKALYLENFPKVESYVLNNNGSVEQAQDVFQEAFLAMWRNIQLDKFTPESESSIGGYLYQIARNKWMDYLRSGHYSKIVPMTDRTPEPEMEELPEDQTAYINAVKKHMKSLGENCRKVLEKFYYQNESLRQISESMGWTEATARNNKYRCIQQLKELINIK